MEFPRFSKILCILMYFQALFCLSFCLPIMCPNEQGLPLLKFKKSFTANRNNINNYSDKLNSWVEGTNCCSWEGVACDMEKGNVIGLYLSRSNLHGPLDFNSTLFFLPHLQELDLSYNDFNGSMISSQFSHFFNLTYLNLRSSNFAGQVPSEISFLSKLVFLDLSYNPHLVLETTALSMVVRNLTKLSELSLNGLDMSLVLLPNSLMNLSSSLSSLKLASSGLQGHFPEEIFHRSNIEVLDLWVNSNLSGSFPIFNASFTSRLWYLALSSTRISIHLEHNFFRSFKFLKELYLSSCNVQRFNLAFISNLTQLTRLDLSNNSFFGQIPLSVGNLEHLKFLHLANNLFNDQIPNIVSNLTQLRYLSLSNNFLQGIIVPFQVGKLSFLNQLDLSGNLLSGPIPSSLLSLPSLQYLFLQNNMFNGHINEFQLSSLKYIDLSGNVLDGPIPSSISKLVNLGTLLLASNKNLTGDIPSIICQLKFLRVLDLSNNKLTGFIPQCLGDGLLQVVSLRNNLLNGSIPSSIFKLRNLKILDLSSNKLTGEISSSICFLNSLTNLDLSNNSFSSFIPQCFLNSTANQVRLLSSLIYVDLSRNLFNGSIPSFLFNLSSLKSLYLGNNLLTGQISQLQCNSSILEVIDFSNNFLYGPIPSSLLGLPSLHYLFLQNNQLTGQISEFQSNALKYLDLSKNKLDGPIPTSVTKLVNLNVLILSSNNKLIHDIPSLICELKSLQILDLSNNSLSGLIPECLGNFSSSLSVLHLGMNNFQGTISTTFLKGNSLRYLNLNGNELQGEVPKSIINCTSLEILDLGTNKIQDTFPYFLETLPELQVLILRSNKFHGSWKTPVTNFPFPKLRILDLSNNNLSGTLSNKYFHYLKAMVKVDKFMEYMKMKNYSYEYSVSVTLKGLEIQLPKIQNIFTTIDLSGNKFRGKIPDEIGKLKSLKQLNLSHNLLTAHIPQSLGNLTNLESLDLSFNVLSGEIPMALVDLTYLQILNLSYNQLEGPIPQGKQFNTFSSSSYQGNLGLCGSVLSKSCGTEIQQLPPSNLHEDDDNNSEFKLEFEWKAVYIGFGCGLVIGCLMGFVLHRTRKPAWLVRKIESIASGLKIKI